MSCAGVAIDHGDCDVSAAFRNNSVELAIGKNYQGGDKGYDSYLDITLTMEETRVLRDWLSIALTAMNAPAKE